MDSTTEIYNLQQLIDELEELEADAYYSPYELQ